VTHSNRVGPDYPSKGREFLLRTSWCHDFGFSLTYFWVIRNRSSYAVFY
jgi:hypothetical protein